MSSSINQTQSVAADFAHELAGPLSSTGHALELISGHLRNLFDEKQLRFLSTGLEASLVMEKPVEATDPTDKTARRLAHAVAHAPIMAEMARGLSPEELTKALSLYEIGFGLQCARLGVNSSSHIIRNLRNFGKLRDMEAQSFDLHENLKMALAVLSHKINTLSVSWDIQKLPEAYGNPYALLQVWMNIIKNAAEAGASHLEILLTRQGDNARVAFVNDGPKLPANLELFTRGATAGKEGGSGIGLSLCKEIVEAHRGVISARNMENGVEFFVEVPLKA